MPYIGNTPAEKYAAFNVQYFTTSATTSYTLDRAVANELDIRLVINNVIQEPGAGKAYTASGTTLTLSAATAGTDTMYAVYIGKAVQTVNPGAGSVGTTALVDSSVTEAKLNVSNSPTNGYVLSAQSGATGGLTWAVDAGGAALTGSTNNTVTTVTGANAIQGETNFIYNGTIIGAGADGANADLGSGIHIKKADSGASADADADDLVIESNGNTGLSILGSTSSNGSIVFGDSGDNNIGQIYYYHSTNSMRFVAGGSEAFRIHNNGELIINNNDTIFGGNILQVLGKNDAEVVAIQVATNGKKAIQFANASGVEAGSIVTSSSSTAFNTSSDYRLKENETPITDGITRLKTLKPYRFNFKTDPDKTVDGFFAHEVSNVVPEAITGTKDAMHPEVLYADKVLYTAEDDLPEGMNIGDIKTSADELPEGKNFGDVKEATKINPQSIDQSKLVPLLTKALQEAITKIETLETKVTALENA